MIRTHKGKTAALMIGGANEDSFPILIIIHNRLEVFNYLVVLQDVVEMANQVIALQDFVRLWGSKWMRATYMGGVVDARGFDHNKVPFVLVLAGILQAIDHSRRHLDQTGLFGGVAVDLLRDAPLVLSATFTGTPVPGDPPRSSCASQ